MNVSGSYQLLSHGTYDKAGKFTPTSEYLRGELIYPNDGFVSVLICFNESIKTQKDILAYSGRYEVKTENEIIHHITLCSQLSRSGTSELRKLNFSENKLVLGIDMENGRFEAVWDKS